MLCVYLLEFKATSTLHCFTATVKGALGKQAEHVLNESRTPSSERCHSCPRLLSASFLSVTHTHTHSQKAWQARGLSIMHVQHCLHPQARRGDGEKGLVLPLGLAEVTSATGTLGEDSLCANGCEFAQIAEYHMLGNKQHSPRCFWLSCIPYKSIC